MKEGGIAAVADAVMAGWLTADFREREPQVTANMKAMMLTTPVEGYVACCEALSTLDLREALPKIKSPTLVIAGRHDMSTPIAAARIHPQQDSRRQHDDPGRGAYFQCRAAARLHRRGGRLPDATLTRPPWTTTSAATTA